MDEKRVDRLLAELTARYELNPRFLRRVRPMVEKIFADDVSDEKRTWLLEVLAQTCQNDLLIRRRFEALEVALKDLVLTMSEMNARLRKIGPPPGNAQRRDKKAS